MDINWMALWLFFVGLGMGYVLSVLAKLDQIESEAEVRGYRPGRDLFEHVDSEHR